MNVQEMHIEFKITLDKVDSQAYPEFLDGEIDFFLNEAQMRFIKQRYGMNNNSRRGFEESQKRTDDLKNLVKSKFCQISPVTYYQELGENTVRVDINTLFDDAALTIPSTDKYMFYLKSVARTCIGNCCNTFRVKLVQHDDLNSIIADPFNKPSAERPILFFEDGIIFAWAGNNVTFKDVLVTFIKDPVKINLGTYTGPAQNCELSEHTHKEIIQMAVTIALENIESQRTQTQMIVNEQKSE